VIYFGAKPWDGPLSIHEMFRSCNERVQAFIPDYKINLIDPSLIQDKDFDLFQSTLKEVLSFIKYSMDKEKLQELVENDEVFRHMGRAEYEVINTCTNSNLKVDKVKEDLDMCQAIREMMEDAKTEGREEGSISATKKMTLNLYKMGLPLEQIAEAAKESVEVIRQWISGNTVAGS
jgi:predicted transposase/invertase (TIGR01784 family)